MAVAFRSDNDVTNGTAGTSVTVTKPSGIVDTGDNPGRDQLIAVIAAAGAPTMTPPADWTLVDTVASGTDVTMWVYRKLASSEGANWTWTLGSSLRNWGWVGAYTGVDPTSPVYGSNEDSTLTASLSLVTDTTIIPSGGYVMAAAATRTASGSATTWTATDFDGLSITERADLSTNAGAGTDIAGVVADVPYPLTYSNNVVSTATASQTQTAGVAEIIALRPYFVPFNGDEVNTAGIVVEAAFDVDPDSDSSDWTWTAVTALEQTKVSIRHGRSSRSGTAEPSELRLTLKNLNGEFTSPSGTYAGKLVRNLPIRVRLNGFGVSVGAAGYHRGTFFLSSARPRWDTSTNFAVVDVVANGRLRRLQQRDEPLKSPAYNAISRMAASAGWAVPAAYWPFEDESDATSAASAIPGVAPAQVTNVTFAANSSVLGSASLATVGPSSAITALVPDYTATGTWTVMFTSNLPSEPTSEVGLLGWYTTGTAAIWQVTVAPGSPAQMHIRAYNSAGTSILDDAVAIDEAAFYGFPTFHTITATQNGTGVDYSQSASTVGGNTGTIASATAGNVTRFNLSPQTGMPASTVLGHIAVHYLAGADGTFTSSAVIDANTGEWPWSRFQRLCEERNVPYTLQASENTDLEMGPQTTAATFMTLVRECETVEGCVITDSGVQTAETGVLWFPARDDRDNITAQLTLDMSLGQVAPAFQPTLDDQDILNDSEVSRSGGSSARVTDETSIEVEGRYKEQVTVNTEDDRFLADLAGWRVNLGTVPGMRFPGVTWNLRRDPSLAEAWVNMLLFQRLDITNPPSQYPQDDITTILEGYTEELSATTWTVSANLSPYQPNHVMVLAETSGDTADFLGRVTGDPNCALRTAIDDNDTSIVFDPNRYRWTTTADDYPMDVRIRVSKNQPLGEVFTASACATTAGTYVAAGAASHADNAAVSPAIYAGDAAGDLILVLAAIRSSGTGTLATPTGYTRLEVFGSTDNVQLFAKVHDGSESAPTVTPSSGSAGDTVSAFTFGLRGTPTTLDDLDDIRVDSLAQLNASAANIAYPGLYTKNQEGCIVLLVAWKQDDYTSIAVPSGFTEILEASTTTGSDQSLYAAYQIQTTPAAVNDTSLAVTGGASAISRAAVVALAAGYQTFTASARGVNGAALSHPVGARIEVEDPGVLAM
jgi:hypothetical protein